MSVGKVVGVGLDHRTGLTRAVIQIDSQYAPRPDRHARDPASQDAAGGDVHRAHAGLAGRGRSSPTGPRSRTPRSRRRCSSTRSSRRSTRRRAERSRSGCSRRGWRSPGVARTSTRQSPSCTRSPPTSTGCWRCSTSESAATSTLLRDTGIVFSALSALAVAASGLHPQLERDVCRDRRAGRRARRDDQGVPRLPDPGAVDDQPAHHVRPDDQAADRRAPPRRGAAEPGAASRRSRSRPSCARWWWTSDR